MRKPGTFTSPAQAELDQLNAEAEDIAKLCIAIEKCDRMRE